MDNSGTGINYDDNQGTGTPDNRALGQAPAFVLVELTTRCIVAFGPRRWLGNSPSPNAPGKNSGDRGWSDSLGYRRRPGLGDVTVQGSDEMGLTRAFTFSLQVATP